MLSANQIVGFLNQLFLQNKLMKQPHKLFEHFFCWAWSEMDVANLVSGPDFLHSDTNSGKLKVDSLIFG